MDTDSAAQLRSHIAQVSNERESVRLELEGVRRTVDSNLSQLKSLLSGNRVSRHRLNAAIQAFDTELRGRLESHGSALLDVAPLDGNQEVLRHTLSDAQRRCQGLNSDMLRVADANEELQSTLRTLKGTNKGLVEEVQKQTDELSNLTQHRLLDMENIARLEEAFKQEKAVWVQEMEVGIANEQRRCENDFEQIRRRLVSQLKSCGEQVQAIKAKTCEFRGMHGKLKAEALTFTQTIGLNLQSVERELVDRIKADANLAKGQFSKLKDEEHCLQAKLRSERQVRERETDTWKHKHQLLAGELDQLLARRDREVSDLQGQIEAVKVARETESEGASKERVALHNNASQFAQDNALLENMTQTARRKGMQLESRFSDAERERERLGATLEKLRSEVRESDEALGEAVRSNEALREQMESLRIEAQGARERDLNQCKEICDRQGHEQAQAFANEHGDLAQRMRSVEEGAGLRAAELHDAQEALEEKLRLRDAQHREMLMWKAQEELASKMKMDVENELTHFKQDCLNGELVRQQEQQDGLTSKLAELEKQRSSVNTEVQQVEQEVKAREISGTECFRSISDLQRQTDDELHRTKANLAEADNGLHVARNKVAAITQQTSERRDSLEQDFSRVTIQMDSDRRELERKIQAEKLSLGSLRESLEQLRNDHQTSFRAAADHPAQQISVLEGTMSEIQRGTDVELGNLQVRAGQLRQRSSDLEEEVADAQARLTQTELELQENTARVNMANASHQAAREALERDRLSKSQELQHVQRSIVQKTEQYKALTRTSEDARNGILQELDEARAHRATKDADSRAQALRTEYPSRNTIGDGEKLGQARLDSLLRENEELRKIMGEQRLTVNHVQDIGSQMQKSLASMEDRAVDLRRGLQR